MALRAEVIVVGAGAAGLYASLCAAREGARVTLVSARPLAETASYWAQGGLAAALSVEDSQDLHRRDTESAAARPPCAQYDAVSASGRADTSVTRAPSRAAHSDA